MWYLQNWSLYPLTLMYSHGTWTWWSLGRVTHMNLTDAGVKGHLGINDLCFKFLKKGSLYPHTLMYFHGTWTQWSLGRVTHVTSTDLGSKVIWVNDLWFNFFEKKMVIVSTYSCWKKWLLYPHTLMYFHGT